MSARTKRLRRPRLQRHAHTSIPSAQFRVLLLLLLLRRLRMPLQLAPRRCSCRGQLDELGDHRAACATSGVLSTRAVPLEHAVARVCREAGARVARHVRMLPKAGPGNAKQMISSTSFSKLYSDKFVRIPHVLIGP